MNHNEFHLEVSDAGPGEYLVRALHTASVNPPRTTMRLDVDQLLLRLREVEISVMLSALPSRRRPAGIEAPLRQMGGTLFQALLGGPVGEMYRDTGGNDNVQPIILHLSVPKLALLPWEAMWDPVLEQYVCLRHPLIRHIPGPRAAENPAPIRLEPSPLSPPLSILGVVSAPRDLTELDSIGEKKRLGEALADQIASGHVTLTWVQEASFDAIHNRLIKGRWHVLHFIGHGDFDPIRDEGGIALVASDGLADWRPANSFASLIGDADPGIRLVVLNSCLSGQGGTKDLFSGTAATLVRNGVGAVAAMQFNFSDPGAIEFSRGFYQALSSGRDVEFAVRSGRIAIESKSLEWVTPVLYARDGAAPVILLPSETGRPGVLQSAAHDATRRTLVNQVAKDLVIPLAKQWKKGTGSSPLADYSRLSVSWGAADATLTEDWGELIELAQQCRERLPARPGEPWADSARDLIGSSEDLLAVLRRVPTGWLVVLGEAGSGKTGLMIRFVRALLGKWKIGDPVPVLVPMKSWDPMQQDLNEWLQARLTFEHNDLAAPLSPHHDQSRVAALLDGGLILPILDGLDEMSPKLRRKAISQLNEAGGPLNRVRPPLLLLTSRPAQFRQALGEYGNDRNLLRGVAAIELAPLSPDQIVEALADGEQDKRWGPVVRDLDTGSPVRGALSKPLGVSLADAIYNVHLDMGPQPEWAVRNPADLCNRERFPTPESIEDHLLDAIIPARYASEGRQQIDVAQQRLTRLARYLQNERQSSFLRWWDLKDVTPPGFVPVVVGTVCGIATAIAAAQGTHVGVGIGVGFGAGMIVALAIGLTIRYWTRFNDPDPAWGMAGALLGAALGAIGAGVAGRLGFGNSRSFFSGLPESLGIGIGGGASTNFNGGLAGGLAGGFVGGVLEGVGVGLPAGLVNGLGVALAAGLAVRYVGRREPAVATPQWIPKVGIWGGTVIGVAAGVGAWRELGVLPGIAVGAAVGAASAWPFGLRDANQDLARVSSPDTALAVDAIAFRRTALAAGLAAAVAGFLSGGMASAAEVGAKNHLVAIVRNGLGIGLSSGIVIGLVFGFYCAASPAFRLVTWWLALRGEAPLRLMNFLADADTRGILRQTGAEYVFRHEKLQRHLADINEYDDPG